MPQCANEKIKQVMYRKLLQVGWPVRHSCRGDIWGRLNEVRGWARWLWGTGVSGKRTVKAKIQQQRHDWHVAALSQPDIRGHNWPPRTSAMTSRIPLAEPTPPPSPWHCGPAVSSLSLFSALLPWFLALSPTCHGSHSKYLHFIEPKKNNNSKN